jgi:hypothetical protein
VVGKGKGKGYGSRLLQICLDDARAQNKHGVVMVASDGVWLAKKDIFLKHGFVEVAQAPPSFSLLVQRFDNAPLPTFPNDWEARQARFGAGLTVIRTPQCPYIEDATNDCPGIGSGKRHPFTGRDLPVGASAAGELAQSLWRLWHRLGWPAPGLSLPPAQGFR